MNDRVVAATLAFLMAAVVSLNAQTEAEALLASATDLRCRFAASVRTTWKDGAPQPALRTSTRLEVTIRNINAASGSALLIRTPINKDLTVMSDEKSRHFIDAGGGRVTVTSVLGDFSTGMTFKAAYTIHDYTALDLGSFKAEPEIVQHWGECEIAPTAP